MIICVSPVKTQAIQLSRSDEGEIHEDLSSEEELLTINKLLLVDGELFFFWGAASDKEPMIQLITPPSFSRRQP